FYAIRHLTGPQGEPVNAIYGLTKMLRKMRTDHNPTHWGVIFDLGAPRQRLAVLPSYKEQRPPTPPDLAAQLPAIREILHGLRAPTLELDGEEADDIIATLAVRAAQAGLSVLIASNDKDFTQLVTEQIRLLRPGDKADVIFDTAAVQAKYGLQPSQMVDFLALTGDSVDNIPGVPGVGPKTATDLLQRFHDLEGVLAHAGEITRPKLRESLLAASAEARLNRQLVQLIMDLPVPVDLPGLKVLTPDRPRLLTALRTHGFKSLVAEVERESEPLDDLFARG
ncbi:MAG: 5'-3' exonuclease H3TH domain-containing protein, partial [Verrucomicrobiota bacterium]